MCYGATVEEAEEDQDEEDIENFVASPPKGFWKGLPFLMEEPQRPLLNSRVFNHGQVNKKRPRLGRQILASRVQMVKRKRLARTPGYRTPSSRRSRHPFPSVWMRSVSTVSVVDNHYNRVYSHFTKRYLLCVILPTGHTCSGDVAEQAEKKAKRDSAQRRASSHALSTSVLEPTTKVKGERNALAGIIHI